MPQIQDKLNPSALAQFTGTAQYWKHPLFRSFVYTDGVQYIGANGGGWIIDLVGSYQNEKLKDGRRVQDVPFQVWTIDRTDQGGFIAQMREDTDQPVLIEQVGEYSDLPCKIELWLTNNVLYLPSEH